MKEIEAMRRDGRLHEALTSVERVLKEKPNHTRALLVRSRLFYEMGGMTQAVKGLRDLGRVIGDDRVQSIIRAIERLGDSVKSSSTPAFVTESMGRLLTQQGYFLEALEIYRRLSEAEPEKTELRDEVERLKTIVEQESSRGATRERVAREIEACDLWLRQHPRGS
jgi:tetratricopeptide (TPR) repeat protein